MPSDPPNLWTESEALIQRGREARAAREYSQSATYYEQAAASFESLGNRRRSLHCLATQRKFGYTREHFTRPHSDW